MKTYLGRMHQKGTVQIEPSYRMNPYYKIVNAVTGEVSPSRQEELEKLQREKQGVEEVQIDFKDPYLALLEGMILMNSYFENNSYYVEVDRNALFTLEEIKNGHMTWENKGYFDGELVTYSNSTYSYLPLMEILKIRSLRYQIALKNKEDVVPFYQELKKLERVTDHENYPSYNRLPTSPEIVHEIKDLIHELEKNYNLTQEAHAPAEIFHPVQKHFGDLYTVLRDINSTSKKNITSPGVSNQEKQSIQEMLNYKPKT